MAGPASAFTRKREAACGAILDACGAIIAERGVEGFTISEVARRAQINRALVYHYFKTRDNLIVHAINHVLDGEADEPTYGVDALERNIRLNIAHPETAKLFFQMLLQERPFPGLGPAVARTIEVVTRYKQEHVPHSPLDPAFSVLAAGLTLLAWAFSRKEVARLLEIPVEEADERFIGHMKYMGRLVGAAIEAEGREADNSTAT